MIYVIDIAEADGSDVDLLGGKGAGLALMTREGLPVPPGFIITTPVCREYLEHGAVPTGLHDEIAEHLTQLQQVTGKTLGTGPRPLLVSVRSGAPVSMPGMMDTILNLGLTRAAAIALAAEAGDTRFIADLTRRFHDMYAETVLDVVPVSEVHPRPTEVEAAKDAGVVFDRVWQQRASALEDAFVDPVPTDPHAQLLGAISAVFRSWNNRRAKAYREFQGIPHTLGTAVVVQAMVFGNLGADSGSGVAFTRNPIDGTPVLYGEFLASSQGEDVVSGQFTPTTIEVAERSLPRPFADLRRLCADLETARGDVLDIEFTIEREKLYLLQVRSAKRTAQAAIRIADDLWSEGRVHPQQALAGVTVGHVRQLQRPSFDERGVELAREQGRLITSGIGASPGQVSGVLSFDSDEAKALGEEGTDVILARPVTSPADLHGMIASRGIVTAAGGATSHAAVVARALGTACVVGCTEMDIDAAAGILTVNGRTLQIGDPVSLDGASGEFFAGCIDAEAPGENSPALTSVLKRCADASGCDVYARITLPAHVGEAAAVGALGVVAGLDDILAANGHLDEMIASLLAGQHGVDVEGLAATVERALVPILEAANGMHVSLRAVDLLSDDTREYVKQTTLLTTHPELALPLGMPDLLRGQLTGLARAIVASGRRAPVTMAVRHLTDVREASTLAALGREVLARDDLLRGSDVDVRVACYATSAVTLARARELGSAAPIGWIELRQLQAAQLGIPSRMLLTNEPLDTYLRNGLFGLDPRCQLVPEVHGLLGTLSPDGIGIRLSLPVTEDLVVDLHRSGYRRFAVELTEVRPLLLSLGKAAFIQEA